MYILKRLNYIVYKHVLVVFIKLDNIVDACKIRLFYNKFINVIMSLCLPLYCENTREIFPGEIVALLCPLSQYDCRYIFYYCITFSRQHTVVMLKCVVSLYVFYANIMQIYITKTKTNMITLC